MNLAVVGATGLVGNKILSVLEERGFHIKELIPVASEASIGKEITFNGDHHQVIGIKEAIARQPDIAIFSAGGSTSLEYAPQFAAVGTIVIDNSSAWRLNPAHKLIVPEINAGILSEKDKIIANPNCSTIQMVLALAPLHRQFTIRRIVVSTYQSVTGTGKKAVDQMMSERKGETCDPVYPYPIDQNVLPHIDVFTENGYTKEEMKLVNETKKILDDSIRVTATAVRLPVTGGHSESVNVEFENPFTVDEVQDILSNSEGIIVQDDPKNNVYPMPLYAEGKNDVFVGRLRRDDSQPNCLNMWIVSDNLRKGAATNAVQIAEYLVNNKLINATKAYQV